MTARSFTEAFADEECGDGFKPNWRLRDERDSARAAAVVLENRIERALAEHKAIVTGPSDTPPYCSTCVDAAGELALSWPCPTVAALTGGEDA